MLEKFLQLCGWAIVTALTVLLVIGGVPLWAVGLIWFSSALTLLASNDD